MTFHLLPRNFVQVHCTLNDQDHPVGKVWTRLLDQGKSTYDFCFDLNHWPTYVEIWIKVPAHHFPNGTNSNGWSMIQIGPMEKYICSGQVIFDE